MDINSALRSYQLERSEVLTLLHRFLPRIIKRFYGEMPLPALSWDRARSGVLGWYRQEDGLALCHRINLNSAETNRSLADILQTLTHELGHEWQHLYGEPASPPYHNNQFQAKMLEIGIPCDSRGHSLGMTDPFVSFLKTLGVGAEVVSLKQENEGMRSRSGSRLKPWSCGCTKVWASAGVTVEATCQNKQCGKKFERAGWLPLVQEAGEVSQKPGEVVGPAPAAMPYKGISWLDNKTILTPTGGFLASGYTHTINPYSGCAYARALCGTFCYTQHQYWITKGRPWGLYGAKRDIRQAYRRDYDRLKQPRQGDPRPLRIYMASSTDPYVPQEQKLGLTRAILEEMQTRPPDVLVIQTHTILIQRDFDLIQALSKRCELWVSITVETDMDPVPGFPPHASRPAKRLETLKHFREAGVRTQATISPLMPLSNPQTFAYALDAACDRVVIDHYTLGDGSHGARTKRTNFLQLLEQAGFGEWASLDKLWEVRDLLSGVLGADRVLVSSEGFNAVGSARKPYEQL
jgi:DNA repair photolyase